MRRFYIITLAILVFISTRGFPVVYHLCEKTGLTLADKCQVCEENEISNNSCCETDNPYNSTITDFNFCCQTKIAESKVDDNFLTSKYEQQIFFKNFYQIILINFFQKNYSSEKFVHSNLGSSPPDFNQTDLNILFSTFLI